MQLQLYIGFIINFLKGKFRAVFTSSRYCIKPGYKERSEVIHYDDTENKDEWQKEVYEYSYQFFNKNNFNFVIDIGCGSAYKLFKYFIDGTISGAEVGDTLSYLKKKYPSNNWYKLDDVPIDKKFDLLICSDVIEHVKDCDAFLNTLKKLKVKYLVFSTPDRNILHNTFDYGPPKNKAHFREWNFFEFEEYMSCHFDIIEHKITNYRQATQLILCKIKDEDNLKT